LNIKLPSDLLDEYVYSIVNQKGKVISSGSINTELSSIDLRGYAAGKYTLTLQNSNKTIAGHFILKD
jgi:hypothetical protein